uniref:Uncharacterized protein n=1 Tax=Arcella intermedia TaxID=1963864 RepID=A0A6B2LLD7_9EUKA
MVLGIKGTGKSSLIIQYIQNHFIDDPNVLEELTDDDYCKAVSVDNESCRVYTTDFPDKGPNELPPLTHSHGYMIIYSITSRPSFEAATEYREAILKQKEYQDVVMVLCATKCDLSGYREVSKEEGELLAMQWGCPFVETSAYSRMNVDEAFHEVVREARRKLLKHKKGGGCLIL